MPIGPIEKAVLKTVAYADLFDYALTAADIHRYLIGEYASAPEVDRALARLNGQLGREGALYALRGRPETIAARLRRAAAAGALWKKALGYARALCQMPYVSMIAVTGSLAMDNAAAEDDVDFFIVTRRRRLWGVRLCVVSFAKAVQLLRGERVCANYMITESNLRFSRQDDYTAHEVAQMVPLYGYGVYRELLRQNGWALRFLPNFTPRREGEKGAVKPIFPLPHSGRLILGAFSEAFLQRWQVERIRRRQGPQVLTHPEVKIGRDCFKGHVDGHGIRIPKAFHDKLRMLGLS